LAAIIGMTVLSLRWSRTQHTNCCSKDFLFCFFFVHSHREIDWQCAMPCERQSEQENWYRPICFFISFQQLWRCSPGGIRKTCAHSRLLSWVQYINLWKIFYVTHFLFSTLLFSLSLTWFLVPRPRADVTVTDPFTVPHILVVEVCGCRVFTGIFHMFIHVDTFKGSFQGFFLLRGCTAIDIDIDI